MLTPDTSARRAFAGPLCNTRFILALGLALMFGSHLTAFSALAQTDVNLIVIKNASGQGVARFTDDGYWFLQGAVHENSGAITLNANKKYWAIRNTTQAVVFAIDCTTGDLFTSGTIEVGQQEFDTTNSLYTLTSPTAGKLLMTVNASGTAALAGAPLPEVPSSPPSIPPLPADPGDPPAPNFQKYYKLLTDGVGSVLCPEPQGQTRIYFAWPQGTFSDVSYKNWRRPYIPGGTPSDYGLRLGCRYWMEPNGARTGNWTFWYGIANSASLSDEACTIQEIDASVSKNESGGYYNYGSYNMDAYHTPGDTWPSTFVVGANPLARSLTDSGNQYNLCQYHVGQFWPYCEPSLKDQTDDTSMSAASSNLWLYRMEWEHPAWIPRRKAVDYNGLTILKEDGQPDSTYLDTPVRVGCWLEGLPNATDIKKITLTLYDPAHPRMMRCLETEQTSVSELFTMWDGLLYLDGLEVGTGDYTGASDVFMTAKVEWGKRCKNEAWYTASDTFLEKRGVAILLTNGDPHDVYPQTISEDPASFAYITPTPEMPDIRATFLTTPDINLSQDRVTWFVDVKFKKGEQDQNYREYSEEDMNAESVWSIKPVFNELRGGEAYVFCSINGPHARSLKHKFQIRGYNPGAYAAKAYCDDHDTDSAGYEHWYTYAICKHESKQTPLSTDIYYNQFNIWSGKEVLRKTGRNYLNDVLRVSNMNIDEGGTFGWGVAQLTKTSEPAPWFGAEEIWNWKKNVDALVKKMKEKRADSIKFINGIKRKNPSVYNEPSETEHPYPLFRTPVETAGTIQGYNGLCGPFENIIREDGSATTMKSCWDIEITTTNTLWTFCTGGSKKNYVHKVYIELE